jgi:hypothetical protein
MNTNRASAGPPVWVVVITASVSSFLVAHLPSLCVQFLPVGQCMRSFFGRHNEAPLLDIQGGAIATHFWEIVSERRINYMAVFVAD